MQEAAGIAGRKGIELGSITLHPDGLPHGPQPGKTEESIGATRTNELAVMVDSFRPLLVSREALAIDSDGRFDYVLRSVEAGRIDRSLTLLEPSPRIRRHIRLP